MRNHAHLSCLVALTLLLVVPAPVGASGAEALRDCVYNGVLDREYSSEDLREALRQAESRADIYEYYDCHEVLERALFNADVSPKKRRGSGPGPAPNAARTSGGPTRLSGSKEPTDQARRKRPPSSPAATPSDPSEPAAPGRAEARSGLGDLPWKVSLLAVCLVGLSVWIIKAAGRRRARAGQEVDG